MKKQFLIFGVVILQLISCTPLSNKRKCSSKSDCLNAINGTDKIMNTAVMTGDSAKLREALLLLNSVNCCDEKMKFSLNKMKSQIFSMLHDYKSALVCVDEMLYFKDKNIYYLTYKGSLLKQLNQMDSSRIYYQKACSANDSLLIKEPNNTSIIITQISLISQLKGKKEAITVLDKSIEENPNDSLLLQFKDEMKNDTDTLIKDYLW